MTRRLQRLSSADLGRYDTLVAEALDAFKHDIMYAISVVEAARSISDKKAKDLRRRRLN